MLIVEDAKIIATGERQSIYNNGGIVEIRDNAYLESSAFGPASKTNLERGTIQNFADGTVTITSATIISHGKYGIANESNLIIGENDGIYNESAITIKGEIQYGILSTGTIKYYDGTITGKMDAISGTIDDQETGMNVVNTTEGGFKTVHLE